MLGRVSAILRGANHGLLILVAALASTGIVVAFVAIRVSSINEQVYHDYARSKAYAEAQQRFEIECRKITVAERMFECFQKAIDSAREAQRAEEDLYAQKQMALWAEWMVYVTLFIGVMTIFVAFASVGLLVDANRLNRNALIASHRAWMKLTGIKITASLRWTKHEHSGEDVGRISFDFILTNIGQSPAFNVWMNVDIHIGFFAVNEGHVRYERMALRDRQRPPRAGLGNTIFPNDRIERSYNMSVKREPPIFDKKGEVIEMPLVTLLLVGCVTYGLFVDKEVRQTGFAFPIQDLRADRTLREIGPERGEVPIANLKIIRGFGDDTFAD